MKKSMISVIAVLALALCMLPASVFADDATSKTVMPQADTASATGGTFPSGTNSTDVVFPGGTNSTDVIIPGGTNSTDVVDPDTGGAGTVTKADIGKASVAGLSKRVYTGKPHYPKPVVKIGSTTLAKGVDYTVTYKNNVNAGTAIVKIAGKGRYTGVKSVTFKIDRAKNTLVVRTKAKKLKAKALKEKKTVLKKLVIAKKARGKVAFKNVSKKKALKKFKVNAKTGAIAVPKNTKKGTYMVKVKVIAKGNSNYKAAKMTVDVKIKVK